MERKWREKQRKDKAPAILAKTAIIIFQCSIDLRVRSVGRRCPARDNTTGRCPSCYR